MATRKRMKPVLGTPQAVEPNAALVAEIHRTAGHVEALGKLVDALPKDQLVQGVTRTVTDPEGGQTVTVETVPNIWLRLYQQERKHLLDVSRTASGCGVEMKPATKKGGRVDELRAKRAARLAGGSGT